MTMQVQWTQSAVSIKTMNKKIFFKQCLNGSKIGSLLNLRNLIEIWYWNVVCITVQTKKKQAAEALCFILFLTTNSTVRQSVPT